MKHAYEPDTGLPYLSKEMIEEGQKAVREGRWIRLSDLREELS